MRTIWRRQQRSPIRKLQRGGGCDVGIHILRCAQDDALPTLNLRIDRALVIKQASLWTAAIYRRFLDNNASALDAFRVNAMLQNWSKAAMKSPKLTSADFAYLRTND